MGTRNLTAVFYEGKYRVAQYGQWDGYPEGQGIEALEFLRKVDLEKFKIAVKETKFLTDNEIEDINKKYPNDNEWLEHYPQLSRDQGAKILELIMNGVKELSNSISFAKDSLFCEWGYVIDLDENTFEVFDGFNKEKIKKGRFLSKDINLDKNEWEPIKLLKKYNLKNLPTKKEFLSDFKENEDEGGEENEITMKET